MKTFNLSLKSMEKQLLNILLNTHDGFFALDREWRYLYLNPVAEKYEGRKHKLLGKVIWEVFPNAKNTLFYKKYHEAMDTGKVLEFEELIDQKWFDIHIIPFEMGIWVFYRDITEHKLIDERKDEFIRMASHELKTPITSLKLYAELLRDLVTGEASEYVHKVNHQADQLNKIITDMLDLSHIEMGRLEFKKRDFNLVSLVAELVSNLQKTAPQRLETEFKTKEVIVYGDKMRLTQAITNLINNAIKYSPGRDRIIIKVQKTKNKAGVSIKDFGIGIDPIYQNQIFDRFFQAGNIKGKAFPGMGIGLYLTKIIVTKHNGEIRVESAVGKGSTFTLSLPIRETTTSKRNG